MLKRKPYTRPPRTPAKPIPEHLRRSATYSGGTSGEAVLKTVLVDSEPYRRLTAARPCSACHIQGHSQAAHLPPVAKGQKQSDLDLFPLCCARVGIPGCHADYDQYRMFSHAVAMVVGAGWAFDNARAIYAAGEWPDGLPLPEFLQPTKG